MTFHYGIARDLGGEAGVIEGDAPPMTAEELLQGVMAIDGTLAGLTVTRVLLHTAMDRSDAPIRAELRKALTRIDWLLRWRNRFHLELERSQLEARLEQVNKELEEE